jgi:hypothetical protein
MSIGLTSVQESNALITINNFNTNGSYVYIENGGTISQAAVTAVAALRSRGWTITCSEPAQAATPVITPTSQYFTVDFTATITCSTEGAVIHYTTDGTNPTASSPTYSAPIPISGATTNVRAIAVATGYSNSGIASATYTYGEEPEPGDIQLVQTQYVRSSDAITMNVTAGNLLLVHGHALNGTYHSVADTASNVYTACGTGTRQDPGVCTNFLWAYASTTGQITITWSHDGGWESWGVSEWSGFTAIDPVDVHTLGANGTTSGTITTTNPNDLILVCWHCESTNMSPVAGNGYTLLSDATTETEAWVYRPVEYKLVTSTVGETTTLTLNSGGTVYSSWAIALKTD